MLRWGLLGTARINRLIIPAIRSSARSVLVAVASRDGARAAAYAAEWQIPRVATYESMLADPGLDIVYVPLPNSLHAAWTIRAVEAGKHVLCEKPLAVTTEEVDAIAAAAARHRRAVAEGFMYRHHAQTARILELVAEGALGELRSIASAFTYPRSREADVRLERALGGGALWDVGCYPVSLAQLLAGTAPHSLRGWQRVGPTGVDEAFAGTLAYAAHATGGGDLVCQFQCGFRAAYQTFLRVVGTEGVLSVDRPFRPGATETLRLERQGVVEDIMVGGAAPFVDEIADMEDAALGIRPPRITLAESRQHVATIVALYAAAAEQP